MSTVSKNIEKYYGSDIREKGKFIFSLDTLMVHTILNQYYWQDTSTPYAMGPFNTLTTCIDHYKLMRSIDGLAHLKPKNEVIHEGVIIRLDFVNKCRLK